MNPNSRENLPQFEFSADKETQEGLEKKQERSMEAAASEELATHKQNAAVNLPSLTPPQPLGDPKALSSDDADKTDTSDDSVSLTAKDSDRIEKQWVDKAKTIVAHTQDDPYKQKHALSKFKADYIKKRFNKTIPSDDTVVA
jgi:hypothetical protein